MHLTATIHHEIKPTTTKIYKIRQLHRIREIQMKVNPEEKQDRHRSTGMKVMKESSM